VRALRSTDPSGTSSTGEPARCETPRALADRTERVVITGRATRPDYERRPEPSTTDGDRDHNADGP